MKCYFCSSTTHNIRHCYSDDAKEIYLHLNRELIHMSVLEQVAFLRGAYNVNQLRMLGVILDLKLHKKKDKMIVEIVRSIMSIRQLVNHLNNLNPNPEPVLPKKEIIVNTIKIEEEIQQEEECPICLKNCSIDSCFTTNCNHIYCITCLHKHMSTKTNKNYCKCPLCRTEITMLESKQLNPPNEILGQKIMTI